MLHIEKASVSVSYVVLLVADVCYIKSVLFCFVFKFDKKVNPLHKTVFILLVVLMICVRCTILPCIDIGCGVAVGFSMEEKIYMIKCLFTNKCY